jgi:ParB-like chromosome segregation protein Spo0J
MAPRNSRTTHPAISQQVEQMLAARNIDYDFEPNVRIDEVRDAEGNQVRFREHRATKDQVQKYATAMKHGATFPAIVLNDAHELIDGNTRRAAALKNGADTIAAYICHGTTPLENRSLSVELNQSNGQSLTDAEIRTFIERAVLDGQHPEIKTLSRMTGVRETKIARWIAETEFRSRATREGITDAHVEVLPDSTRAALNVTRLAPVFKELTTLAAEARMPANDVKKVVTAVNSASSEAEALAIVGAERQSRVSELRAVASGFKPREHRSKGSAQHVGGLLRFTVEELLDVAPEKQFETYDRLMTLRDRLNAVVDRAEREWNLTPPAEDAVPALAGASS